MSKYALRRSTLALSIGASMAAGSATAATLTVTTAADGPIGTVPGCSLREAIASANNGNGQGGCTPGSIAADSIVFDGSLAQSTITLGEGPLDITSSLTITGPVAEDPSGLTIDGDNLSRIFSIEGLSDTARINTTIEQITLTRGRATGAIENGGAINGRYVNLTLDRTVITGNSVEVSNSGESAYAVAYGGGLSIFYGSATVTDSRIENNTIASYSTGDFSVSLAAGSGLVVAVGTASLVNTAVTDNHAEAAASGMNAYSRAAASVVMANPSSPISTAIVDSSINQNTAQSSTTGTGSSSRAYGGGLFVSGQGGNAMIIGSTIASNSLIAEEPAGGGILNRSSDMTLINSTVSGNTVAGSAAFGSGVAVVGFNSEPASLVVKHSTVALNSASNGSEAIHLNQGVSAQSTLELDASLVVQGSGGQAGCNVAADTANFSLATDSSCTGTATAVGDIKLTGLSDNGGPTLTHGLLPGSLATGAVSPCLSEPVQDQRGLPRPGSGSSACDIGALEVQQDDDFDAIFGDRFEQ